MRAAGPRIQQSHVRSSDWLRLNVLTSVLSHLQVARQWRPSPTAWWRSRAASRSSRAWFSTGCWSTAPPRRPCRLSARTPAPSAWKPRMPCSTTARSRFANVSVALAGRSTASGSTGRWGLQVSWRRRCASARLSVCPSHSPLASITSVTTHRSAVLQQSLSYSLHQAAFTFLTTRDKRSPHEQLLRACLKLAPIHSVAIM